MTHSYQNSAMTPENLVPFRSRSETPCEALPNAVDQCLDNYFKQLNGMSPAPGLYQIVMNQVEKPLFEHVLRYVKGNQLRAAEILGINRNTLRKKLQEHDICARSVMAG